MRSREVLLWRDFEKRRKVERQPEGRVGLVIATDGFGRKRG